MRQNPVTAALRLRDRKGLAPLQIANGLRGQYAGPGNDTAADAVKAAWLPTMTGQAVPMLGEQVSDDAEPCFNE